MKNKNIYILGVILTMILGSCESLDLETRTTLSQIQVERSYDRTKSHNAAIYTVLQEGFANIGGAMTAAVTDEAEYTIETSTVQKFNTGAWNPFDNPDDVWGRYFRGIRLANNFLVMSDTVNLDYLRLDPSPNNQALYLTRLAEIKRWKYEARFLRAFFYFELVKRYGGVPVITRSINPSENISSFKRNTLQECIRFISDECDSTAANLPLNYASLPSDVGRATKGAALALKSRLLLYAASDLFNTPASGYPNPELVSLPSGDRIARWQAAANAAKAVMDIAPSAPYSLYGNYRNLFLAGSVSNYFTVVNEVIFARRAGTTNTFEKASYPIGTDLAEGGTTPSQNLVDAYEMKNGLPITDPASGYDPADPYKDRDPRLGYNVIWNNSTFNNRKIECWETGRDGKGKELATKTGYYLKKYVVDNLNLLTNKTSVHSWIFFRYAEILLNYAEALNEAQGPVADVYSSVNAVRTRAGMPDLPQGLSQSEMRDRIRNERRVELAFEDHRAWDVRRWMLGDTYFNAPLRGVDIIKNADNTFSYTPIEVENRIFDSKMYFYPIPQSELNIMTGWVQNPGWDNNVAF